MSTLGTISYINDPKIIDISNESGLSTSEKKSTPAQDLNSGSVLQLPATTDASIQHPGERSDPLCEFGNARFVVDCSDIELARDLRLLRRDISIQIDDSSKQDYGLVYS
ncbi:hypothetical protein F444_22843 [Phytophthora nicotianae P1976]|uniref:Uncharacterized protein n=2 Tax=Phytophthora nicotianae TaxID=4792 RepID=A0A080YWK8_PHYNI|nr:hypothetical protein F444_22843 [Phytophthora nicotianae P1976]